MLDSLKNDEVSESVTRPDADIQEIKVDFPLPINVFVSTPTPLIILIVVECSNNAKQHDDKIHP